MLLRSRRPIPAIPHSSLSASSAEASEVSAVSLADEGAVESSEDMMLLGWPSEETLVGLPSSTGLMLISGVASPATSGAACKLGERLSRFQNDLDALEGDFIAQGASAASLGR
jgi:hypothetical protein